jgi:hypothetical protein
MLLFRYLFSISLAMKKEAVSSLETSVNFYRTTRRHILKNSWAILHSNRRENIKPNITLKFSVSDVTILLKSLFGLCFCCRFFKTTTFLKLVRFPSQCEKNIQPFWAPMCKFQCVELGDDFE